jgi:hypothetical protein
LVISVCPVQVSAAAAFVKTGAFDPARTLLLLLAATAIIAWLNLRWAGWFGNSMAEGCRGWPASEALAAAPTTRRRRRRRDRIAS